MRVLVTGSAGFVGSVLCPRLRALGHVVVPVDRATDGDVLGALPRAFDAVVHAAALMGDEPDLHEVNVAGTANVLAAARGRRVVFLSSVDVFGVFKGENAPDYLPLDVAHPCRPASAYGLSKTEAEELCRGHDAPTVILRPPGVWDAGTYSRIAAARAERPSFEWEPYWEYGAFVDVRDLVEACVRGLACPLDDHATLLVSAPDITTSGRSSRELAEFVHPSVKWRGGAAYDADPHRTLLDIDPARRVLTWSPRYSWRRFVEGA